MDINRSNYEAYFLDFVEGNLSAEQEEVLHRFLRFNPDLASELESFTQHIIEPEKISFPGKKSLRIDFPVHEEGVNERNFDFHCIAYFEGDLNAEQRKAFDVFLTENPAYDKQFEAFKASYLQMEHLAFPDKNILYKKTPTRINWNVFVPVAAAAALAFLLFLGPRDDLEQLEVASLSVPENLTVPATKGEEEKEAVKQQDPAATLKVVRGNTEPVPVTNYSKDKGKENAVKEMVSTKQNKTLNIAGLKLNRPIIKEIPVKDQKIELQAFEAPSVHYSSFTVREIAEYQIQRAKQLTENEDEVLFSLASAGIKELSKITGSNAKILASRNQEGEISGIKFRSRFLNVSAPIANRETE